MIFICSPYAGDVSANTSSARRFCYFAVTKGKTPIAPHLLFPTFLDDSSPDERRQGLKCGKEILTHCDELWCFGCRITSGMRSEITTATQNGIPVKYFTDTCEESEAPHD